MCISARNSRRRAGHVRMRILAATAFVFLTVGGCAVGPDFVQPMSPAVTHYTSDEDPTATVTADGSSQQFTTATALPADWWRLFDCPKLNDAVQQGLTSSPTITMAEANLREAKDNLRSGEGMFYPQLNGGLGVARERPSTNATPGQLREGIFNLFTLSSTVSYTLDVFGGERRAVEGIGATVDYQQNAARASSLTLASNIANTMIAAAAYDAEIQATMEIVRFQNEQVRLAEVQAKSGTAAYAAVLSLQTQLETTEAALPPLRQKLTQSQDLLSMLEGRLPAEAQPPRIDFGDLSLPRTLPVSLPSALVRQRPDILQAQASLHAASAQIGVATAAMLPSITLDGSFGYSNTSITALLMPGSKLWSLGVGVTQPLFHDASLWFQRKAAIDAYDASAANYRQTVLLAFQQVADTLRALEHDADGLAVDEQALHTASRGLELVQANYGAGLTTYSDVLIADAQYRQARIANIEAQALRYQDTVALFVALGGGWWNDPDNADLAATR